MCSFRKYPYSPRRRDWKFLGGEGGWGVLKGPKIEGMKLDWNFQRGWGGGGLRKNPFHGGGMDYFWNHTMRP